MSLLMTVPLLIAVFLTPDAYAQGVRIVDCQGKTKAFRQNLTTTDNVVRIDVIDAAGQLAENGEISLVNAKGTVLKSSVTNGIAEFPQISPGVWMISSSDQGLFFTQIALSDYAPPTFWQSAGSSIVKGAEIALVVGAAVGAAILIDDATDGSSRKNGSSVIDTPSDNSCTSCNPDAVAPSIPDFN